MESSDIKKITELLLDEVAKRISALGIDIEFSDEVIKLISEKGYDSAYGARPLRRTISKMIEDTFAAAMIDGTVKKGMSIRASVDENENIIYIEK